MRSACLTWSEKPASAGPKAVGEKRRAFGKSYPQAPWMEDVPILIYHEFTVSQC